MLYYDKPELWQNYDTELYIRQKADTIAHRIPKDTKTILDVGCGNGIITNVLSKQYDVTGMDVSTEALQYVQAKKVLASATEIPFSDSSFDLVISSQMLEHLDRFDMHKAVNEIQRVSGKYIIISVPNAEYLPKSFIKCPQCSMCFHAYHHYTSFNKRMLTKLFDKCILIHSMTFGPSEQRWIPLLVKLRQYIGKQWFQANPNTVCPNCGNQLFYPNLSNLCTKLCNGINRVLSCKKPYWLMCLYKKVA